MNSISQQRVSNLSNKDILLGYVLNLIKKRLKSKAQSEIEYLQITSTIKSIFDMNLYIEEVLSELNKFFEKEAMFSPYSIKILDSIEQFLSKNSIN